MQLDYGTTRRFWRFGKWDRRTLWTLLASSPLLLLAIWFAVFSLPQYKYDHRSPRYVLWKHGLFPYSADIVRNAMLHDPDRDALVRGLTRDQVRAKLHFRTPAAQPTAGQQWYMQYFPRDRDYLWLDDTFLLIDFQEGRAVSLEFVKG